MVSEQNGIQKSYKLDSISITGINRRKQCWEVCDRYFPDFSQALRSLLPNLDQA
ncbi:MAG: hypothetical protein V7K48_11290 [Nostoc sp.]|uniref:hypothetical protein n=1 Tax=Nostoc sp. TaxID=1180 RepID=UPI002FF4A622